MRQIQQLETYAQQKIDSPVIHSHLTIKGLGCKFAFTSEIFFDTLCIGDPHRLCTEDFAYHELWGIEYKTFCAGTKYLNGWISPMLTNPHFLKKKK